MSQHEPTGPVFVRDALRRLGVRRFVLGVHASAFPASAWDAGYGAPLSAAGQRLLTFAARLGFDALQLGPTGQVSVANLSPYDSTVFARNPWSLDSDALTTDAFGHLLSAEVVDRLELGSSGMVRVQPERASRITRLVIDACHESFWRLRDGVPDHPLIRAFVGFRREHESWLEPNAAYEAAAARFGDDPSRFNASALGWFRDRAGNGRRRDVLGAESAAAMERSELAQFLCHAQHARFRELARREGLSLWGDLQVGYSHRDRFLHEECFPPRWRLGAPPSRTNPDGQPWGYPLLDPDQLDAPASPARELFARRLSKLLSEHDGVRIDHPHGLVCPWIYRADDPDAHHAVRHGARAFESPESPEPDLARWAIPSRDDLNPAAPTASADNRVRQLSEAQVARYARLFDVLAELCDGRSVRETVAAEVLSTCPYPLSRVLLRHGLGRFRVIQKADPTDPDDVYRTDQARPEDWLMLGTHDTAPVFAVAAAWVRNGSAQPRAVYLAERLIEDPAERPAAAARFAATPGELLCASLADLLSSRAENVYVFIGDLFGETEPFNRAGVIDPHNWTARLPEHFEGVYAARRQEGCALDVEAALRLALSRRLSRSGGV